MVLGLRLRLRAISQHHRKENERAAQRGNGHHPVDAQSWNEETLLHLNTRAGYRASIPSDLTDYDPYAFLWDTPPLFCETRLLEP